MSLEHKSDAGGVALGLGNDEAVMVAAGSMWARLGPGPLSVERMIELAGGVELVVGARRDPRFGAVVLVGLGGIYTEILGDVAAALAPVDEPQALQLLSRLRGAPLLFGARGRPPLAVDAAARAVVAVSRLAAGHPEIAEPKSIRCSSGPKMSSAWTPGWSSPADLHRGNSDSGAEGFGWVSWGRFRCVGVAPAVGGITPAMGAAPAKGRRPPDPKRPRRRPPRLSYR